MNKLGLHNIATSKKIEINSGPRKPIDNNCLFELLVHTGFLFKKQIRKFNGRENSESSKSKSKSEFINPTSKNDLTNT